MAHSRFRGPLGAFLLAAFAVACGGEVDLAASDSGSEQLDSRMQGLGLERGDRQPVEAALARGVRHPLDWDRVFTLEHHVDLGPERRIFVRESFTLESWFRHPRRAILMASAVPVTDEFLNIPIDGYRGRELLAKRGFFAFTMDLEGAGRSSYPTDGFAVTYDSQTKVMLEVVERIRAGRGVPRVDLYGEGEAAGVAAQACADAKRTRSCTLASLFYADGTPFFEATFNSPEFRALVLGAPQGYLPLGPEAYFNLLSASPTEVVDWVHATQPGTYSMGLLAEHYTDELPAFDASQARVPGLIIRGEFDQNAPLADSLHLAADYGATSGAGPASVVQISGAKLLPRIEAAPQSRDFWQALLDFVEAR